MKENKNKNNYESPMVEVMTARVEAGYAASGTPDERNARTSQYGTGSSWDDPRFN